jgi:hypothetical protein
MLKVGAKSANFTPGCEVAVCTLLMTTLATSGGD